MAIGQQARGRTRLTRPRLLAVTGALLALLTALLASAPSASAAPGDLSHTSAWCYHDTSGGYWVRPNIDPTYQGNWVQVRDANDAWENIRCPDQWAGYPVNLKANGTTSPEITPRHRRMSVTLSQPVVKPGATVTVTVQLHDWHYWIFSGVDNVVITPTADPDPSIILPGVSTDAELYTTLHTNTWRLDYLTTSGALANPALPAAGSTGTSFSTSLLVPIGTAPGEYLVAASATASICSAENDDPRCRALGGPLHPRLLTVEGEATLTVVDDYPARLSTAALATIGLPDDPQTGLDESRPATDTAPADGGVIWLQLNALDDEDELVEALLLDSNLVLAVGGDVELWRANADGSRADRAVEWQGTSAGTDGHTPLHIAVRKSDKQPGTVAVSATVVGRSGSIAEADPIVLNFTGSPAAVTLGDDVRVGQPAAGAMSQAELALGATDAAGNDVPVGTVSYSVTDADGNPVDASMVSVETSTAGSSTTASGDDNDAAVALVTVNPSAEPGAYTITASIPGVDDSSDSAAVAVAGPVASLTMSADPTNATMVSEVITVTAMVSDAAGVAVADGVAVTFTLTSGPLVLVGRDADSNVAGHQSLTKDGAATAKFVVIGSGSAVIAGSSGGQSAVAVASSTIAMTDSPEAEATETPRAITCLLGQVGFLSWTCSAGSTASVVLAELSERGVNALYLYNESEDENDSEITWTSYAMVDGKVIPGSVDFTINQGDILYVSR